MIFKVIDKETGKEPVFNTISEEEWYKESYLLERDIDRFFVGEDGQIILINDCGNVAYVPRDRFKIYYEILDRAYEDINKKLDDIGLDYWNLKEYDIGRAKAFKEVIQIFNKQLEKMEKDGE